MTLTAEQQKKVEQNIRLVQKVINDKVHGPYQLGIYTYDDIFQIGCIGLCKAAATDKGGTFSTYVLRVTLTFPCPRISLRDLMSTPASTQRVAKVCLRA